MKNTSCHDEKMEAYYNAVRALEDKFYDIKLNHVPRSTMRRRTSSQDRVGANHRSLERFARDIAKPSVDLRLPPSSQEEPSRAPSNPAGAEPMDEDPSNETFVVSLLEAYVVDEAGAMETEPAPRTEDWRAKYLAWMNRGELPPDRSEARRIAKMAKSFTIVDSELEKRRV
jgi:hypothetical protein